MNNCLLQKKVRFTKEKSAKNIVKNKDVLKEISIIKKDIVFKRPIYTAISVIIYNNREDSNNTVSNRLLMSIQKQTYKNFEIIIPEQLVEENVKEFMKFDERIKIVKIDKNMSPIRSLILQSQGHYITLINVNDLYINKDTFSSLKNLLLSRGPVDIVQLGFDRGYFLHSQVYRQLFDKLNNVNQVPLRRRSKNEISPFKEIMFTKELSGDLWAKFLDRDLIVETYNHIVIDEISNINNNNNDGNHNTDTENKITFNIKSFKYLEELFVTINLFRRAESYIFLPVNGYYHNDYEDIINITNRDIEYSYLNKGNVLRVHEYLKEELEMLKYGYTQMKSGDFSKFFFSLTEDFYFKIMNPCVIDSELVIEFILLKKNLMNKNDMSNNQKILNENQISALNVKLNDIRPEYLFNKHSKISHYSRVLNDLNTLYSPPTITDTPKSDNPVISLLVYLPRIYVPLGSYKNYVNRRILDFLLGRDEHWLYRNYTKILIQGMESILQQTVKNIDIIYVNLGPENELSNMVRMFSKKDKRILLISNYYKEKDDYIGILKNIDSEIVIEINFSDIFLEKDFLYNVVNLFNVKNLDFLNVLSLNQVLSWGEKTPNLAMNATMNLGKVVSRDTYMRLYHAVYDRVYFEVFQNNVKVIRNDIYRMAIRKIMNFKELWAYEDAQIKVLKDVFMIRESERIMNSNILGFARRIIDDSYIKNSIIQDFENNVPLNDKIADGIIITRFKYLRAVYSTSQNSYMSKYVSDYLSHLFSLERYSFPVFSESKNEIEKIIKNYIDANEILIKPSEVQMAKNYIGEIKINNGSNYTQYFKSNLRYGLNFSLDFHPKLSVREDLRNAHEYIIKCENGILTEEIPHYEEDYKPDISIFLPTYNKAQFLLRAIRSIQNQSFKNLEMIFVDDHSTDDSVATLEKLRESDPRIRIIKNFENKGCMFTRGKGILNARGKYLIAMDPDDMYCNENLLKIAFEKAVSEGLDIVEFKYIRGTIGNYKDEFVHEKVETLNENKLANKKSNGFIWNKLVKRNVYLKAYDRGKSQIETLRWNYFDDNFLCFLLLRSAKSFAHIDVYGYFLYNNNESLWGRRYLNKLYNMMENYLYYSEGMFNFLEASSEQKKFGVDELYRAFMRHFARFRINKAQRQKLVRIWRKYLEGDFVRDSDKNKIEKMIRNI